jgi:hypothetical protein
MATSNADTQPQTEMPRQDKKEKQISFKVDGALERRIETGADLEGIKTADFVRKLVDWSLDQYEVVGSIRGLRCMALPEELIEQTLKDERHAFRNRLRHKAK